MTSIQKCRLPALRAHWPRSVCAIALAAIALSPAFASYAYAERCVVPASHRAWGGFALGSWKKVRVTTETLDESGKPTGTNVTETKSTLVEVDSRGYMLLVETSIVLANRRVAAKPRYVRRNFNGEAEGQKVVYRNPQQTIVKIKDDRIPSQKQQYVVDDDGAKRVCTVYYSHRVAPFILRRKVVAVDVETNDPQFETSVEVVSVSERFPVDEELKPVSHVKTTHKEPGREIETLEVHSAEVPGAVVKHTSIEKDEAGNPVRRSELELLDYGIGDGRQRIFRRRILFPNVLRRLR